MLPPFLFVRKGRDFCLNSFYVPWSFDLLMDGVGNLMSSIGQITNIGLWIFFIIAGIAFIRSLL